MIRNLFKLLSLLSLFRAVRNGPTAVVKREARRRAHRMIPCAQRG